MLINRNNVPINTWVPWNPVATKKVEPYTLSAMVNIDSRYSISCSIEKYIPSKIVNIVDKVAILRFPDNRLWWASVIVIPELNRMAVFSSGILSGSIV